MLADAVEADALQAHIEHLRHAHLPLDVLREGDFWRRPFMGRAPCFNRSCLAAVSTFQPLG